MRLLIFALAYALTLQICFEFFLSPTGASCFWPAIGLSMGALLLCPRRGWPAVVAISLLLDCGVSWWHGSLASGWGYNVANSAEAVLGAALALRWQDEPPDWLRQRWASRFLGFCAGVAPLLGATLGASWVYHRDTSFSYAYAWRVWLMSDQLGILTVAPVLLWARSTWPSRWGWPSVALSGLLVTCLFQPGSAIFSCFLCYLWLLGLLFYLGPSWMARSILAMTALALGMHNQGLGPFAQFGSLPGLQIFLVTLSVSMHLLAVAQVQHHQASLDELQAEHMVERTRVRYEALFQAASVPAMIWHEGHLVRVNGAAQQLLGDLDPALELPPATGLWHPRPDLSLEVQQGQPVSGWLQLVLRDVSQEETLRQELELTNRVQEVSIAEATSALQQLNQRLNEALIGQNRFLASISHELRTPLSGLLGLSETLLGGLYGKMTGKQQVALERVSESTRFLISLVNDLLQFARLSDGAVAQLKRVSALEICQASLQLVSEQARSKGLELRFEPSQLQDLWLLADPKYCQQILVNLLVNAIKFSPQGQVLLSLELSPLDRGAGVLGGGAQSPLDQGAGVLGELLFHVHDSGPGVEPGLRDKIFEPYFKSGPAGGSGLGLALARTLAASMGGQVELVPPGPEANVSGAHFVFRLPYHVSQEADPPASPGDATAPVRGVFVRPSLLIADDDAITRRVSEVYFRKHGYPCWGACDGQQALELLQLHRPQILLTDIWMPKLDGLELMRRVRQLPEFADLKIIAWTALAMPEDEQRCLEAGANLYLSRPLPLPDVEKALSLL